MAAAAKSPAVKQVGLVAGRIRLLEVEARELADKVTRSQDALSDRRLPKWKQDILRLDEYLTQQLLALDTIQTTSATRERVRELRRALVARIDSAHTLIDSIKSQLKPAEKQRKPEVVRGRKFDPNAHKRERTLKKVHSAAIKRTKLRSDRAQNLRRGPKESVHVDPRSTMAIVATLAGKAKQQKKRRALKRRDGGSSTKESRRAARAAAPAPRDDPTLQIAYKPVGSGSTALVPASSTALVAKKKKKKKKKKKAKEEENPDKVQFRELAAMYSTLDGFDLDMFQCIPHDRLLSFFEKEEVELGEQAKLLRLHSLKQKRRESSKSDVHKTGARRSRNDGRHWEDELLAFHPKGSVPRAQWPYLKSHTLLLHDRRRLPGVDYIEAIKWTSSPDRIRVVIPKGVGVCSGNMRHTSVFYLEDIINQRVVRRCKHKDCPDVLVNEARRVEVVDTRPKTPPLEPQRAAGPRTPPGRPQQQQQHVPEQQLDPMAAFMERERAERARISKLSKPEQRKALRRLERERVVAQREAQAAQAMLDSSSESELSDEDHIFGHAPDSGSDDSNSDSEGGGGRSRRASEREPELDAEGRTHISMFDALGEDEGDSDSEYMERNDFPGASGSEGSDDESGSDEAEDGKDKYPCSFDDDEEKGYVADFMSTVPGACKNCGWQREEHEDEELRAAIGPEARAAKKAAEEEARREEELASAASREPLSGEDEHGVVSGMFDKTQEEQDAEQDSESDIDLDALEKEADAPVEKSSTLFAGVDSEDDGDLFAATRRAAAENKRKESEQGGGVSGFFGGGDDEVGKGGGLFGGGLGDSDDDEGGLFSSALTSSGVKNAGGLFAKGAKSGMQKLAEERAKKAREEKERQAAEAEAEEERQRLAAKAKRKEERKGQLFDESTDESDDEFFADVPEETLEAAEAVVDAGDAQAAIDAARRKANEEAERKFRLQAQEAEKAVKAHNSSSAYHMAATDNPFADLEEEADVATVAVVAPSALAATQAQPKASESVDVEGARRKAGAVKAAASAVNTLSDLLGADDEDEFINTISEDPAEAAKRKERERRRPTVSLFDDDDDINLISGPTPAQRAARAAARAKADKVKRAEEQRQKQQQLVEQRRQEATARAQEQNALKARLKAGMNQGVEEDWMGNDAKPAGGGGGMSLFAEEDDDDWMLASTAGRNKSPSQPAKAGAPALPPKQQQQQHDSLDDAPLFSFDEQAEAQKHNEAVAPSPALAVAPAPLASVTAATDASPTPDASTAQPIQALAPASRKPQLDSLFDDGDDADFMAGIKARKEAIERAKREAEEAEKAKVLAEERAKVEAEEEKERQRLLQIERENDPEWQKQEEERIKREMDEVVKLKRRLEREKHREKVEKALASGAADLLGGPKKATKIKRMTRAEKEAILAKEREVQAKLDAILAENKAKQEKLKREEQMARVRKAARSALFAAPAAADGSAASNSGAAPVEDDLSDIFGF